MKLKVKNFQSIKETELEVEGFTVITGRSSIGKSALIRATAAAFFGWPGDHYVKTGETFTGVVVDLDDTKVTWRKVKNPTPKRQTALQVGPDVHTKLGRDHGELTAKTGVVEIQVGPKRFRPQVAGQHDQPFLLTETETTVAEIFKVLGRADTVTNAQALAGKDRRQTTQTLEVRERDTDLQEQAIEELNFIDALRARFETQKGHVEASLKVNEERAKLKTKIERVRELGDVPTLPDPVTLPPGPEEKTQLLDQISKAGELQTRTLQLADDAATIIKEVAERKKEKEELEKELDECPTCGREW